MTFVFPTSCERCGRSQPERPFDWQLMHQCAGEWLCLLCALPHLETLPETETERRAT